MGCLNSGYPHLFLLHLHTFASCLSLRFGGMLWSFPPFFAWLPLRIVFGRVCFYALLLLPSRHVFLTLADGPALSTPLEFGCFSFLTMSS